MDRTELTKTFNVGDRVVYPSHGIGMLESKVERNGKEYFRFKVAGSDSVVLLPAANPEALGLRSLSSREEIEEALDLLSDRTTPVTSDWKQRFTDNQSLLKTGSLSNLARVVSTLYRRSKVKELPSQEKRMYEAAVIMLVDEVSSVLNKGTEETERLVFSMLEKK